MKIFEALLLNESIVDDLRNSLVKGLLPDHGLGTKTYDNLLKEFEKVASWAKNRLRKGEAEDSAVDNSKVVWLLTWFVLDPPRHGPGCGVGLLDRGPPNRPGRAEPAPCPLAGGIGFYLH